MVVSAAAGRMRVHAIGFRHDAARAAAIEETVAKLTGVRAVRAYPRTESVVVWYASEELRHRCRPVGDCRGCATFPPRRARTARSPVARGHGSVLSKSSAGWRELLNPRGDGDDVPPEIERLRTALDRIGYHLEPPTASRRRQDGRRNSCARGGCGWPCRWGW